MDTANIIFKLFILSLVPNFFNQKLTIYYIEICHCISLMLLYSVMKNMHWLINANG